MSEHLCLKLPFYLEKDPKPLSWICKSVKREHLETEDIQNAVLIAHSKGNLIGKYYLVYLNNDDRVKGMVSVAAPFSGTELANFVGFENAKELQTSSEIVINLQRHTEVNSKIISIFPKHDDMIWHEKGSYLEGALDNIQINARGHNRPLFSKEGKEIILGAVERLSKT